MKQLKRKFSKEEMARLCELRVEEIKPFEIMLVPIYVHLKENGKVILVKEPLDYFTDAELKRFSFYDYFYIPNDMKSLGEFHFQGSKIRQILHPEMNQLEITIPIIDVKLLAPFIAYEASHLISKEFRAFWGHSITELKSLEIVALIHGICHPIPERTIISARDKNIDLFEMALCLSSWVVFLSLHLGYCQLDFISRLRLHVFDALFNKIAIQTGSSELNELVRVLESSVQDSSKELHVPQMIQGRIEKICQKINFRLGRIRSEEGGVAANA